MILKIATRVQTAFAASSIIDMFDLYDKKWSTHSSSMTWTPPEWLPRNMGEQALIFEQMNGEAIYEKGPRIRSRSAFLYDLDKGEVLFAKDEDGLWPVASLTKTVAALALASEGLDHERLEKEYCLSNETKPYLRGAKTRFYYNKCYSGWDLFGSALVSSDNGAALSFPLLADLPTDAFVEQMNQIASDLDMNRSQFVDAAGLGDENLSTARDMTKAIVAATMVPTVSIPAGASSWYSRPKHKKRNVRRTTTNKLLDWSGHDTLAAKTGFTYTADGCFSIVTEHKGRRLALTILGAPSVKQRWRDAKKILGWAKSH